MRTTISVDDDHRLLCPSCEFEHTHVNAVQISARREDQVATELRVDAITGDVTTPTDAAPTGPEFGEGRRHRIALVGRCENGHGFAIVFTQHKGHTYVEAVPR